MTVKQILWYFWDGKITLGDCIARLDKIQVRGDFMDDGSFVGYDYDNQEWVEVSYLAADN